MSPTGSRVRDASVVVAISNEMVRVYKQQFGRGPTKARTHWCGDDIITVVLHNTFTPAERRLAAMGEHARLREMRMVFQYAAAHEFCEPVERLSGRTVHSFVTGIDTAVDGLSVETFILEPRDAGIDFAPSNGNGR